MQNQMDDIIYLARDEKPIFTANDWNCLHNHGSGKRMCSSPDDSVILYMYENGKVIEWQMVGENFVGFPNKKTTDTDFELIRSELLKHSSNKSYIYIDWDDNYYAFVLDRTALPC